MASVGDYIFLFIVLGIVGGIVYAVKGAAVSESIQKQKEAMKAKGLSLDDKGLAVKTNRHVMSREEEVERTQASFAKSGKMMAAHANAFSFGGPKSKEEVAKEKKQRASEVSKEEAAKAKKKYG